MAKTKNRKRLRAATFITLDGIVREGIIAEARLSERSTVAMVRVLCAEALAERDRKRREAVA